MTKSAAVAIFCVVGVLAGCGGGGSSVVTPPPPVLQSIVVNAQTASVAAGLTEQLTATGSFSDGTSKSLPSVTWASSDTTLATVSSTGLVTTLKQGNVTISATSGSVTGTLALTVAPPLLQSIAVSAPTASVAAGLTDQLTATGSFSDGTSKSLTSVTWTSSDATLATVSSTGLVTTLKQGNVTISASSGSVTGNLAITVAPPLLQSITVTAQTASVAAGLTDQLTATGSFSDGTTAPLTSVTWTSSDATLATVNSTGLVTTLKQGNVTFSASSGSVMGTLAFTVAPPAPVSLAISPARPVLQLGGSQPTKLTATLTLTDNSTVDVSNQAAWSTANPFAATVDASGNVTAVHTGYSKISASNANLSATADLGVVEVPRYLYVASNSGRIISRTTIDPATGQARMAGNVITNANNLAFSCLTTDPSESFLYVGAAVVGSGGEILVYSIDQNTGTLTAIPGSPFAATAPVGCIQFERTGKFGYTSSIVDGTNQLLSYSRNPSTGALTPLATLTLNGTALQVAVDPMGQYLYAATIALSNTAQAYAFSIDATSGALTPVPGTPFALTNVTGVFSFHPSGNFLYMANSNGQSIDIYAVDRPTGKLTAAGSLATCINPTGVRFSSNGVFAYTACSEDANHDANSASVESFAVAADGSLTHLGSSPFANAPFDLNFDPSRQFLYLSANASYVYPFQIDADGVAKPLRKFGIMPNQSSSMATVGGSAAVAYTTTFAYVSSTGDNTLTTYPVQAGGTLGAPAGGATPTQLSPFSLSTLPWGSDLLVASSATNSNITEYPLSATTGLPGPPQNFGDAATSGGVKIDPTGQWAFESDSKNGVIFTYGKINGVWQLLRYVINGSTVTNFAAGAGAGPMLVDPAGRFLYVANQGASAKSISAYQYFGTSPELLESTGSFVLPFTDGSPFSVGATPLGLAMDPTGAFLYVVADDQTLQVYAVDYFSGGHLAKVASVSLSGRPAGVAAEPTGRYVYAADTTGVKAFSLDPQSGALTPIPLNPAVSLSNVAGVYVEPSGKYLYVATNAALFAYTINSDGTLIAVPANPVATSNQPSSITFSADIR